MIPSFLPSSGGEGCPGVIAATDSGIEIPSSGYRVCRLLDSGERDWIIHPPIPPSLHPFSGASSYFPIIPQRWKAQ